MKLGRLNNYPVPELRAQAQRGLVPATIVSKRLGIASATIYQWVKLSRVDSELIGTARRYIVVNEKLRKHIGEAMWKAGDLASCVNEVLAHVRANTE